MFKTIDDIALSGRTALVRADLNVPLREGKVTDRTRITRLKPTVDDLIAKGAKVVLLSHFARPKGERVPEMSLKPLVEDLADEFGRPVRFAEDCIGGPAERAIRAAGPDEIVLLENLRFHPGEEANDPDFARALAALGGVYVNDAFSAAHRAHASTERIAHLMPAIAGRNMQAELEALTAALEDPKRPVAAIVGGAKVSTKLDVLENLIEKTDLLIIGGGMANTFLHAEGVAIGKSLCEPDLAVTARRILTKARERGCEIALPHDAEVAIEFAANVPHHTVAIDAVDTDMMILDIGPATTDALAAKLADCRTLIWNGPMGAFEVPPFDRGTVQLARKAAELTDSGALISVAGGGDTVAALAVAGVTDHFTYVSTAGGAFLEWMEGRTLPGVAALERG
ncbi:phosphoglycerate kinase [Marivibrio halodurans]|uniref:Phosphoglycerate kinase n=1 Tax=Marivibrio halodurans TaxID=2039722 RepID=A0A8J7V5D3_9PROT|nr:phosphoglycerate kinase [Marivibrio halodurans]MBP5858784.1 phosphoglycerate kinase [Marivibrio halodurans]